jgi:hypothetical protein
MTTGTDIMNRRGGVRMAGLLAGRFLPALLVVCSAAIVCGGCALPAAGPVKPVKEAPRQVGTTDGGKPMPIMAAELDELTRAFADRYVGLLSSTCDALKKDNPDLVQRREVQELMLDCAMNVYDIASNPDAFTRMLDLVVVTTLVSQVWIDDDRAWEVFGDRGEVLVRALHHGRVEAWALAAQVLRPEQLDLMDYLLWDWRRHNPDMVRVPFVRLSTFAIGRGKSANAEVLAASGLYANVGQQGQAVAEARLLGERVFYLLKREPTLLRWQVVALQDEMLVTLNDRKLGLDGTLTNVRGVVTDAHALVTSLDQTSHSLNEMFKAADAMLARYDAIHSSRPFDIREYMETVKEVAVAAEKMNDLLKSSNELLGSSEWERRVQQVSQSADERIKLAAEQSQRVVNDLFWRVYVAMFAMLILCLVVAFLVIRRSRTVTGNARDAGRKETPE